MEKFITETFVILTMQNEIPFKGLPSGELFDKLESLRDNDFDWKSGKTFGAVYYPGDSFANVISKAYQMYKNENAFDPQLFKSLLTMENEVVQQTASLLSPKIKLYGNITSGGTESIFLALLSAREWSKKTKNVSDPEIILSSSAHPAFTKACKFLEIKPIVIPTQVNLRLDFNAYKKAINNNTILLVGSAPAYPYGMIDPIAELSQLALENQLLLHVDACIGGFILSHLRKMGYEIPPFDFSLPGVTSLSVDLHKYAYAPKGSSVLLYKNEELRKTQFSVQANWQGGVYASTTFLGTKPGGIVASSWAALNHIGEIGYLHMTQKTWDATQLIKQFIIGHNSLELLGEPDMSILAFKAVDVDTYKLADQLNDLGWYIGRLQNPEGIHLVISQIHADGAAQEFLEDLSKALLNIQKTSVKSTLTNISDKISSGFLNLLSYNKLRSTIVRSAVGKQPKSSKKRLIYGVKEQLDEEESNELFRSIMNRFYS